MTGDGPGGGGRHSAGNGDPFGSAAEEAVRLVDALGQWIAGRAAGPNGPGGLGGLGGLGGHIATDSAECRICPLCQVIALLRNASPELARNLDDAVGSLLAVARLAMDTVERQRSGARPTPGFETIKID